MKRTAFFFAAVLWSAASLLLAAEPLNLSFEFSGVSPEQGEIVEQIVEQRLSERSAGGELHASYAVDASFDAEEYSVETNGSTATLRAGSFPGLIFATGKLLRSINYAPDSFTIPSSRSAKNRLLLFAAVTLRVISIIGTIWRPTKNLSVTLKILRCGVSTQLQRSRFRWLI